MNTNQIKTLEKTLKACANKRRLEILQFLKAKGKASVGEIAKKIRLSFRSTSRHLSVLSHNDLVDKNQIKLMVEYQLVPSASSIVKEVIKIL